LVLKLQLFIIFASQIKQATMTWNEIVYGLGDLITATFKILPTLGNIPNILFSGVIFAGLVYWILELKKYRAEAKKNGTIE